MSTGNRIVLTGNSNNNFAQFLYHTICLIKQIIMSSSFLFYTGMEKKNHNFLNININKKTHVLQIISSNYIIIIIICYAHTKYMNNNCKKQKPTLNNCQKKKSVKIPKKPFNFLEFNKNFRNGCSSSAYYQIDNVCFEIYWKVDNFVSIKLHSRC